MTARIFFLIALTSTLGNALAVDLNTLPPMNQKNKFSPNVELKGRELEALEVALRQFREDRFSASGDLKHFTVELFREPGKLFVGFYPEYHPASSKGLPGRNKYGTYVTYAVSLRTLKVIGYHFERD
jgi:hypothetical protein